MLTLSRISCQIRKVGFNVTLTVVSMAIGVPRGPKTFSEEDLVR
jgi:hypothetical protein